MTLLASNAGGSPCRGAPTALGSFFQKKKMSMPGTLPILESKALSMTMNYGFAALSDCHEPFVSVGVQSVHDIVQCPLARMAMATILEFGERSWASYSLGLG